jgi:serine/threonine-protein kinase
LTGEQAVDLPAGAIVGEYRIERKLKQGGMGTVYAAVHQKIDKRAAVKVLKRELCENDDALRRFVQEARAVNQINHPNIVDVFGFGVTEDRRSFLAMELLVGETLGERMARGAMPRAEVCEILTEITHALEAAHTCGVVHRDLKPENVFLVAGRSVPMVKLLDFGIAKLTGGGGLQGPIDVTQPGTVIGTPKYIAPEQARGLVVDGSADIYALGVIAFELLAGRAPFIARDPVELIAKHITLNPSAPSEFAPHLPPVADELIVSMLDKRPTSRPSLARVRELMVELKRAPDARPAKFVARHLANTIVDAVGEPQPAAAPVATTGATIDATVANPPQRRLARWLIVPAALSLVALVLRIAVGFADRGDVASPPPTPAPPVIEPAPVAPQRSIMSPVTSDVAPGAAPGSDEDQIEIDEVQPAPAPAPRKAHHAHPAKPPEAKPPEPKQPLTHVDDDDGIRDPFHHH